MRTNKYKTGDKCKKTFVKKNKVLIREWARVIASVNSFRGFPGLKGLKVLIIRLVND